MSSETLRERAPRATVRLGRVERVVLDALIAANGLTPRDAVMDAAFPELRTGTAKPDAQRRARAEAATSRAIQSLERKGLVVRHRNARTGRTLVSATGVGEMPDWEQIARAEEDLAVHCRRVGDAWRELAARAYRRAAIIRRDRSTHSTEGERERDLREVSRLEAGR